MSVEVTRRWSRSLGSDVTWEMTALSFEMTIISPIDEQMVRAIVRKQKKHKRVKHMYETDIFILSHHILSLLEFSIKKKRKMKENKLNQVTETKFILRIWIELASRKVLNLETSYCNSSNSSRPSIVHTIELYLPLRLVKKNSTLPI